MTNNTNPTAEQIIAEAMVNAGAPLMHSRVEEAVANALRAHGLLGGDPTEEQIERVEGVIRGAHEIGGLNDPSEPVIASLARAVVIAAGVAPQSGGRNAG